jgi:chromatin segregation and condensation protein Rec8/ScpA/Scc1 (kleisin family)
MYSYDIVRVLFLCYILAIKGVDFMSDISAYIKSNKKLKSLDFLTVYLTIIELVKDGQIELKQNV